MHRPVCTPPLGAGDGLLVEPCRARTSWHEPDDLFQVNGWQEAALSEEELTEEERAEESLAGGGLVNDHLAEDLLEEEELAVESGVRRIVRRI